MLLAIKRLSQGRFLRAEQLRSNHAQAFVRIIRVQRISQHGRLVWSIDVDRHTTPSQVSFITTSSWPNLIRCNASGILCRERGLITSCGRPRQAVKIWAYTVEGQLSALVRRVEATLRMYSQDYLARCTPPCVAHVVASLRDCL